MTIRYTCTACGAVLKIKEEKAGTQGRCPQCKVEFLVPASSTAESRSVAGGEPSDESVDMPLELTPTVSGSGEFDPSDVLSAPPRHSRSPQSASVATDRKPSVAELMRDFELTRKKERKGKSSPEVTQPSAVATEPTAGSAADLISRAYQQKRETSTAPVMRPEEIKAAEQKELLRQFLLTRVVPIVAAVVVFIFAYSRWMNREVYSGPPLYSVSGMVTRGGVPAAGVTVQFEPIPSEAGAPDNRSSASGTTGVDGKYRLYYTASHEGAPAGDYSVQLFAPDGLPAGMAAGEARVTVRDTGVNEFDYELK